MRRLDFYVQHMLRQSANAIVMNSNEAVEFRFESGKVRRSNQAISHKQVIQLVREVAPPDAGEMLRTKGRARFQTPSADGSVVHVDVDASSQEHWRVFIATPEAVAAMRQSVAFEAPPPPPPPPEDDWESLPSAEAENGNGYARNDDMQETDLSASFADMPDPRQAAQPAARGRGAPPPPQPPRQARPEPPPPQRAAPRPGQRTTNVTLSVKPPAPPPTTYQPQQGAPLGAPPPAPPPPAMSARVGRAFNPKSEATLQKLLRNMIQLRASDLHLSSGSEPMVRIDGEMRIMDGGSGALRPEELMDMLLAAASPDVRRIFEDTNDADYAYELENIGRFRMNYFIDRKGPGLVARVIPFDVVSPEHLGLPASIIDLCWLTKGLVLVTGPTGSGKSTTLASLIDFINRNRADHIITIEDPIEYVHTNKRCLVNQRQVGLHTSSFAQALRAALREDPDVVVVGEMRDLETISIAIETAETGHLVFGTLHTTTAPSTVDRIIDQFPAEEQSHIRAMLSESLRGVLSQVLIKKNGGGRVGAYELLMVNSAAANLIREGKTFQLKSVMQTGRHLGMQTMNDHLLDLIRARAIDVKDAYLKAYDKGGLKEMLTKHRIPIDPALLRGEE